MNKWLVYVLIVGLFSCGEDPTVKSYHKFEIQSPELNISKTIWVYLPANYQGSGVAYPVIYMQDAQWIFDANQNYSQEMHVDETLRGLEMDGFEGAIVVGIESDESTRADEFALYYNPDLYAGGKGQVYLDFLVKTLKPQIDVKYRTLPDRKNTYIMGASLGGLVCFYALTDYGDVFGRAALFSAALHFNRDSVMQKALRKEILPDAKMYAVVGASEFNELVDFPADNQLLFNILVGKGKTSDQFRLVVHEDGEHKIWFWDREFPNAIKFLFP